MILLDTNVVSEIMKLNADAGVQRWYLANGDSCWLSTVTLGEVAFGIALLTIGAKRARLEAQLSDWRVAYARRTHAFNATTAMIYGDLMADARKDGRQMTVPDAQIAAIASEHGLTLATRNLKDFQTTTALTLVNPWLAA